MGANVDADVIIVGAGPVGLCLAKRLSGRNLKIVLLEQQQAADLEAPAFDGREIALTQHSAALMRELDLWQRIDPADIAPLRDARVMDGSANGAITSMLISHALGSQSELGWLVSNHLIREAAWQAVQQAIALHDDVTLLTGEKVIALNTGIDTDTESSTVTLASGTRLSARLVVAADSRFSATRRMAGIAAHMYDFGKNMLVATMTLEKPHDFAAWEWFGYGQTLALLPMNPHPETGAHRASVVLTLPSQEVEALMQMPAHAFNAAVAERFGHRLGAMQLVSTRHNYPLVGVLPQRLVTHRFATVGDAAVGMHPVTAHGFNFGLLGVETLAQEIAAAQQAGRDIGNPALLRRYESKHRRATLPLFCMTRLIVELYTRDNTPAKLARQLLLRVGERLTPFKRSVAQSLSGVHQGVG